MKRFLIHTAIVGLVCFGSCIAPVKEREATGGNSQGEYIVSLHVTCPEMELRTRALDPSQEKRIADLNIYFYHKTLDIARHIYSKGSTDQVVVSLFSGDYDLYALPMRGAIWANRTKPISKSTVLHSRQRKRKIQKTICLCPLRKAYRYGVIRTSGSD